MRRGTRAVQALLLTTPTMSVGVEDVRVCLFVRLFVCLSVCPEHNSKTNDPKVFNLSIGNDLWNTLEVVLFWSHFKGQSHRVTVHFAY